MVRKKKKLNHQNNVSCKPVMYDKNKRKYVKNKIRK